MINRNTAIAQIGEKTFSIETTLEEAEKLSGLIKKYGCVLHVKIAKPISPGTEAQNNAMHALLTEYYKTGMHNSPEGTTLAEFKNIMKAQYGPQIIIDHKGEKYKILKSWADYTKQERTDFIEGLLSEIHQSGAYTESIKIQEIILGMEALK